MEKEICRRGFSCANFIVVYFGNYMCAVTPLLESHLVDTDFSNYCIQCIAQFCSYIIILNVLIQLKSMGYACLLVDLKDVAVKVHGIELKWLGLYGS